MKKAINHMNSQTSRTLGRAIASLISFGMIGTNVAADSNKPSSPPPYQIFEIYAFTEAEAKVLWPTGADAYATQEEAAMVWEEYDARQP